MEIQSSDGMVREKLCLRVVFWRTVVDGGCREYIEQISVVSGLEMTTISSTSSGLDEWEVEPGRRVVLSI